MAIFNRLPKWPQIAAVYAVIVLIVYSWTILWFFWKFPSWLYFLSISEVLTVFAYSMALNFFESLLVLCLPLGLGLLLPKKWFSDAFVTRGVVVILLVLAYSAFILTQFQSREDYPGDLVRLIPLVFLAALILAFFAGKAKFLDKAIGFFAEQAIILLYLYIPISIISILVVLGRLIF